MVYTQCKVDESLMETFFATFELYIYIYVLSVDTMDIVSCVWLITAFGMLVRGIVQELCESRGGHPELPVLTSLLGSMDVKNY